MLQCSLLKKDPSQLAELVSSAWVNSTVPHLHICSLADEIRVKVKMTEAPKPLLAIPGLFIKHSPIFFKRLPYLERNICDLYWRVSNKSRPSFTFWVWCKDTGHAGIRTIQCAPWHMRVCGCTWQICSETCFKTWFKTPHYSLLQHKCT